MSTLQKVIKTIKNIVKECCDEILFDEYYKTTEKLINKLKKNKNFSMDGGMVEGWAAGLLYVVGEDSDLFNRENKKSDKLYLTKQEVANTAGVSTGTMRTRATEIRAALPKNANFTVDLTRPKYEVFYDKAKYTSNIDKAIKYMEMSLEEARKEVSPDIFEKLDGNLWSNQDTRVCLIIKDELADLYMRKKDYESAVKIYKEIIKEDEGDNQNIRYKIFQPLIYLKKIDELEKLFYTFEIDFGVFMSYNKLLYYYVAENKFSAKLCFKDVIRLNKYIPEYLFGAKGFGHKQPEFYSMGTEDEAIIYQELSSVVWA